MIFNLDEAKAYLRVDSDYEDGLILSLMAAAEKTVMDVARLQADQWQTICDPSTETMEVRDGTWGSAEVHMARDLLRVGSLYALGYLYEHREEADHHDLTMTLRSLLSAIREGVL